MNVWYNPGTGEERRKTMEKTLNIIGCVLWIAGLATTITGLNIPGNSGRWLTVIGNIAFLIGLGIVGALWLRKKKSEQENRKE